MADSKLSDADHVEIIRRYESGESGRRICKNYDVHNTTIYNILRDHGVKARSSRRYQCNQHFFDRIDSETKAYWLGFIGADGNVSANPKSATLTISLSAKDREHLLRFQDALQSNYRIYGHMSMPGTLVTASFPMTTLCVNSVKLLDGLKQHGVHPRKSLTYEWPDSLPDHLLSHYLRGYFDGDGSFIASPPYYNFHLLGSQNFMVGAHQYLVRKLELPQARLRRAGRAYSLTYRGRRQVSRIARLMYANATIRLERKYAKIKPILHASDLGTDHAYVKVDADRLGALRRLRGLSMSGLCEEAGVGIATVCRLESGSRQTAKPRTIRKLAEALRAEPSELVGYER